MTRFGPAGNSESFTQKGYKKTLQVPTYLAEMGLNAYEYQCGRGVRISEKSARELGEAALKENIKLSLHAPYYISLSSLEEEKRIGSIEYILQSARAVNFMGGDRIVVHSGSCSKLSRQQALEYAKDTMKLALHALDAERLSHIRICPETMGKVNQLGTLEEVIELCKLDERMLPCIDFGHLNARTFGQLSDYKAFEALFDYIEHHLGISRLREYHAHFSKIEYTTAGGEKRHLTFEDEIYGPNFEPVCELSAKKNCNAVIICESAGTQAEDAATMKAYYTQLLSRQK